MSLKERENKLNSPLKTENTKNLTFDHNGKIIFFKNIKQDTLPEDVKPKIIIKRKFNFDRLPNRPEDVNSDK